MPPPTPVIPLPHGWPEHAKSALVHAVALAHRGLTIARGWCADSPIERVRLKAENARFQAEVALLRDELEIKDARMAQLEPPKRPHYPPEMRFRILTHRAARGWNAEQVATRFQITGMTIANWQTRIDEQGPDALVQVAEPVNRFPDLVAELVKRLKATVPTMGKVRIAQVLARAGLHLAPSTAERLLARPAPKRPPPSPPPSPDSKPAADTAKSGRTVIARYPNHVWGADLTVVPTALGFWVPWVPFAALQQWPFCWWVVVVVDHFSRRTLAAERFAEQPSASEVCAVLDRARSVAGAAPKYAVTDKGRQFQGEYREWCERHQVRPRFGAIGKHGSIALVERFIRALKREAFGSDGVPLGFEAMQAVLDRYVVWHTRDRPHQGLAGRTPLEVFEGRPAAHLQFRLEPRARYPARAPCAAPRVPVRGRRGAKLELVMSYPEGAPHLPSVSLRRVA